MKSLLTLFALVVVSTAANAQLRPVLLNVTPGISSDSAIAVLGGKVRDTSWTGVVNRRIEKINIDHVKQYGIEGGVILTIAKGGMVESAFWLGGVPPQRGEFDISRPSSEVTWEDAESVRDSLSTFLGKAEQLGGFWTWNTPTGYYYLTRSDIGLSMNVSAPRPAVKQSKQRRKK